MISRIDLHASDFSEPLDGAPISPELALVDPDLASFARARLPVAADCLATRPRPRRAERAREPARAFPGAPPPTDERVPPAEPLQSLPSADDQAWLDRLRQGEYDEPAPLLEDEREREHERPGAMAGTAALIVLAVLGLFAGSRAWQALTGGAQSPAAAPTLRAAGTSRSVSSPLQGGTAVRPVGRAQQKNSRSSRRRSAPLRHPARRAASAPRPLAGTRRTHVFVWPPVSGARSYRVEFFRKGRKIFQATPGQPRLELPVRWRFRGHPFRLVPGAYVWLVRPVKGSGDALRYGRPITRSRWLLQRGR